jgi:hypothetical protein
MFMGAEGSVRLKFVCLRSGDVLRLHMYTNGGTLMSSLHSRDEQQLKALTLAWLGDKGMAFDEAELDAAIGRAFDDAP